MKEKYLQIAVMMLAAAQGYDNLDAQLCKADTEEREFLYIKQHKYKAIMRTCEGILDILEVDWCYRYNDNLDVDDVVIEKYSLMEEGRI